MLKTVRLQNYLFVPSAELDFGEGMTALTGETGAGKSILVGAISLIFASSGFEPEAWDKNSPVYLEAEFEIGKNPPLMAKLEELGHSDGETLILGRQIGTSGRSSYYINGRKVASNLMREMNPLIIDFHHQRDQQRLLQNSYQLEVLDSYAGLTQQRLLHGSVLQELRASTRKLDELKERREQNLQLAELYRFQAEELEAAAIADGEEQALQHEFDRLSHAQQICESAAWINHSLFEKEGSARDLLRTAISSLERYTGLDERIAQVHQSLADSIQIMDDSALEIQELSTIDQSDPARLQTIQDRLDLINSLLHKHRVRDTIGLKELFAQRLSQIGDFEQLDNAIAQIQATIDDLYQKLLNISGELSEKRALEASRLSDALQAAIRDLAISDAQFEISIDKKANPEMLMSEFLVQITASGADRCEFLFSANLGSKLKPLAEVASGGELSRVLLAIKKVLAARMEPHLLILDEIDAGIGGKTAEAVAATIRELALNHKVLCITHLASIAAAANWQIQLTKRSEKDKTLIEMTALDEEGRIQELARMLSGSVSEASIQHAKELINKQSK